MRKEKETSQRGRLWFHVFHVFVWCVSYLVFALCVCLFSCVVGICFVHSVHDLLLFY